jgi:hypothetical protein
MQDRENIKIERSVNMLVRYEAAKRAIAEAHSIDGHGVCIPGLTEFNCSVVGMGSFDSQLCKSARGFHRARLHGGTKRFYMVLGWRLWRGYGQAHMLCTCR